MKIGDYVKVIRDSYVYKIKNFEKDNIVVVEDGHSKLYTVDKSKIRLL
jgi:hypothetical protein